MTCTEGKKVSRARLPAASPSTTREKFKEKYDEACNRFHRKVLENPESKTAAVPLSSSSEQMSLSRSEDIRQESDDRI